MVMTAFQRRLAAAVVSLTAVTATSAAMAPPASAAPTTTDTPSGGQYWGSIAASQHLGDDGYPQLGGVKNMTTKADAEARAISNCGQSDCEAFIDFQDCGVAAYSPTTKHLVGGTGASLKAAQQAAAAKLGPGEQAKIMMQGCNTGFGTGV
jgi:hypothetical protein